MDKTVTPETFELRTVVGFPPDNATCQYCPVVQYDTRLDRARCPFTAEMLPNYKVSRGIMCPMMEVQDG